MTWPNFKKGDKIVVVREAHKGRTGICLKDNTETGFGHKHVHVRFDERDDELPLEAIIRTAMLEKKGE